VAFHAIFGNERAAKDWLHLKNFEQIREAGDGAGQAWMFGVKRQAHWHVAQEGQTAEGCGAFLPDIHVGGDWARRDYRQKRTRSQAATRRPLSWNASGLRMTESRR